MANDSSEALTGHSTQSVKDEVSSKKVFDQEDLQYRNKSYTKQHLRHCICANSALPVRTGDQQKHYTGNETPSN